MPSRNFSEGVDADKLAGAGVGDALLGPSRRWSRVERLGLGLDGPAGRGWPQTRLQRLAREWEAAHLREP